MKHSSAFPLNKAGGVQHRQSLRRKSFVLKIFLGLTLFLLVACASAAIAPEEELALQTAAGAPAAKPDLGEPSKAIPQQAGILGEGQPVGPASIPSVENTEEVSKPASQATDGTVPEATQLEPESANAVKEDSAAAGPQPIPEPLQAPAAGPRDSLEDSSSQISLPPAPAFTLTSASGETVSLETYRGAPATTATPAPGAITRCWPSPPAPATC